MGPLELVHLTGLMERTSGRPEIRVGLIDGPVLITNPDFAGRNIQEVFGKRGICARASSAYSPTGSAILRGESAG